MRITSLEPESRAGGVRVRLDGEPFGTVSAADAAGLGLSLGGVLTEQQAAALALRAEVFSAHSAAMSVLASRPVPALDLLRRLLRKGHPRHAAEEAVQHLQERGLVDDAEFARHYVRTRARRKRLGPRRLEADLRRLGVGEKVARAAVSETLEADGVDTGAVLREAAERKARQLSGLAPEAAKRRLRTYLLRRGFGGAEVSQVVRDALAG